MDIDYNTVDVIKSHITGNNARTYTQLPARVDKFYEDTNCIDATLLVSDSIRGKNVIQAGKIINVPVLFSTGGSFKQGFKLVSGDTVLLHFCMRSLDNFHNSDGKEVTVMENKRYHDISDCFATTGAFTKKNPIVSEEFKGHSYLLDGNTSIVFNKDGDGLTVTSDKDITVTSTGTGKVNITGDETVINEGTGYAVEFSNLKVIVDALVVQLNSHTHTNGAGVTTTAAASATPLIFTADITTAKVGKTRIGGVYVPPPPPPEVP